MFQIFEFSILECGDAIIGVNESLLIHRPFFDIMNCLRQTPKPMAVIFCPWNSYYEVTYDGGFKSSVLKSIEIPHVFRSHRKAPHEAREETKESAGFFEVDLH